MKRAAFLFVAVLLCLAPAAALAQNPTNAVTLKLGAYVPQADADDDEFDSGFNGELSFTRHFHPNFAFELGVGYFTSESDNFDSELTVIPITLNLKAVYPVGGVELYALAGIGAYMAEIERGFPFNTDDDDTTLGFQAGAGLNFNVTPVIFIGAEGKYFWAEPELFGNDFKINGFQATANLGYRF